ncbi:37086_t:CDS:2, partial [Gigaspora margarita]
MAQRNFINTSIDVLDEARTYGAKELISDMPKALGTKSTKRRSIDNGTNKIVDVSVSQSAKKVSTEYNLADNNLSEDYLSNFFLRTFIQDEVDIRDKILKVLASYQKNSLNEDQLAWFTKILEKKASSQTDEFREYLNQFSDNACNRVHILTLVRKSFVLGRFDSYYYENYDIAHQILEHWCADVLSTANDVSKIAYTAENNDVCATSLENTPITKKR